MVKQGVLVGLNRRQEWLVLWWWEKYSLHNCYPVSFADFGMSKEMRQWCETKGEILDIQKPPLFVADRDEVCSKKVLLWENKFPDGFWDSREAWFQKPLACKNSLYDQTVWIDLDCEIKGSIAPIFHQIESSSHLVIAKDLFARNPSYPIYNSGVFGFLKKHPLIQEWADQALSHNKEFRGDQDLLSWIIEKQGYEIQKLPKKYNQSISDKTKGVIVHWMGDAAKAALRAKIHSLF